MNLADLFPYHSRQFTGPDGVKFSGWLAQTGSANVPGLSAAWQGTGMNLWTQDLPDMPPTGLIGGTITDETDGTKYLISEGTLYSDYADGGAGYWLLQVKESRAGR